MQLGFPTLACLIIATFFLISLDCRKKKKKPKTKPLPKSPKEMRPQNVSEKDFCNSCKDLVRESIRELRGKKKESDVLEVIEEACTDPRLNINPNFESRQACEAFLGIWSDQLADVLTDRVNDEIPMNKLCVEITQACEGDTEKKEEM